MTLSLFKGTREAGNGIGLDSMNPPANVSIGGMSVPFALARRNTDAVKCGDWKVGGK